MLVKKTCNQSKLPTRSTAGSAGYDLFSTENKMIYAGGQAMIDVGINIKVPPGTYGRVAPRSGLAVKHGIDVLAGVIDEDYRGDVKVVLINHGDKDYMVSVFDRVAQLIIEKIETPEVKHVISFDEVTQRGIGGFGSTGI